MSITEEVAGHVHLYPGIADTHTHLILLKTKEMEWKTLVQTCIEGGLELALDVGTNTDTFQERLDMVSQFSQLYLTTGLSVSKSELEADDLKRRLDDLEKQVADVEKEETKAPMLYPLYKHNPKHILLKLQAKIMCLH